MRSNVQFNLSKQTVRRGEKGLGSGWWARGGATVATSGVLACS